MMRELGGVGEGRRRERGRRSRFDRLIRRSNEGTFYICEILVSELSENGRGERKLTR